ncbi:hypothetical protein RIF29_39151 [Crotalaria pallida]|uniref:Transcription factor TFIIIC triple barrel domain-containing protein n=1 Tax=Crotalaria pallida TaxID=3830 RepID=A0AAN9E2E2_CROPI
MSSLLSTLMMSSTAVISVKPLHHCRRPRQSKDLVRISRWWRHNLHTRCHHRHLRKHQFVFFYAPSFFCFQSIIHRDMEANVAPHDHEEQDEEYVLLDLNDVSRLLDIPPNAKYVLTGLDTLNPVMIIDDKFKLIGEYEETIGTCIAFTEQDTPAVHEETGPSEANLFSGTRLIDSNQPPTKQVKPLCQLHKVLKFRMSPDSEIQSATAEEAK